MLFLSRFSRWMHERRRHIFRYYDGTRWRRADPLSVGTGLERACPEYLDRLYLINKNPETVPIGPSRDDLIKRQGEAAEDLARAARDVFGLKPLSDTDGVTGGEAIAVLTRYFLYMEGLANEASVFTDSPKPA